MKNSWYTSKYFGWVTSRIYNGSMDDIEIQPEWKEYSFVQNSWSYIDAKKHGQPIVLSNKTTHSLPLFKLDPENNSSQTDLFNASSLATEYLLNYLTESGTGKSKYKNSTMMNDFMWKKETAKIKNRTKVNFFYMGSI